MSNIVSTNNTEMMFQELVTSKLVVEELNWLNANIELIKNDKSGNKFLFSYSLISRFISNNTVEFNKKELSFLEDIYPLFSKKTWNKHSLCRALLMTKLPVENNKEIINKLIETSSNKEQEDLYKSLFFLENAQTLVSLVEEGIRSNVISIYDAIAHYNPFAACYLSENSWNQLVLKGIFNDRPLFPIYNLYKRNNQKLALIANDYIHERWSAGRTVTPEIWQLMIGNVNKDLQTTLTKAVLSKDELERKAALTVLQETNSNSQINKTIWLEIGKQFNNNK
jgi:hypothetical protein